MENFQKIAVLIDADNTQLTKLEAVLHEVSTYGRIVVKKAYGNWRKDSLKNWESELKRLAIRAEQQFDYVTGKNTTDIAMVIGAMDLLHTNMYDALVLVSSDSDFTPLAIRLRESGLYIIGAGVTTTPESFKNACDDFILIDYLAKADDKPAVEHTAEPAAKKPAARKAKKTARSTKKPATEPTPAAEPEASVEPAAPADEPESYARIRTFVSGLLEHMGIQAQIDITARDNGGVNVNLSGSGMGAVIGRRGETLDAIQHLTNYAVNRGSDKHMHISVDAESYRAKREESLVRLAEKMAAKAVKYKRSMALEPMNSYERHVIHTALQDYEGVTTSSTGTEPNRRVVVSYEKPQRPSNKPVSREWS